MDEQLVEKQGRPLTFLRCLLIDRPPQVEEKNYPTFVPFNFGTIVGALDHMGWLIIFFILDVTPLFLFNIISVFMWVSAIIVNRKGFHFTSSALMIIEIILHQALCVIFIGWGTGFQYWILVVPMALIILPPGRNGYKFIIVFCSCLEFVLLDFFYRNLQPIIDLGPLTINIINYVNIILVFIIFPISMFYFSSKMNETRKALLEEQKKVENAYNLLSKYVAPQLANKITDGKIDKVWKHSRKKLTLFFSDIKDFTMITDSMEPEDMAKLLNEYFTEMNLIINRYKGTLSQVIGDALYVFFGAPESSSDKEHAVSCVNMAVDMQNKMGDLNKRWFDKGVDELLLIRCGVNTGMATVGGFGSSERREYTAMGMQVNIAARLEQACEPGGVLISHTTWALVKDQIACTEQGQVNVKGVPRPLRVYSIDAVVS